MDMTIVKGQAGEADHALLKNGLTALFWEDQQVWVVALDEGLIRFPGFYNQEPPRFAEHWSAKAARACVETGVSPQQWWECVKTVLPA